MNAGKTLSIHTISYHFFFLQIGKDVVHPSSGKSWRPDVDQV